MLSSDSVAEGREVCLPDRLQQQQAGDGSVDKYMYEFRVVQQPLRARMCGFGEKDRRPCTPPPILQLILYDRTTGQSINMDTIDTSFFTATCSLYSADMEVDMDLISQRSAHESGHTSSGASTATMSHRQAISDGLDIADDRNEHMLPSAVPGGSNDTSSSSIGARPYYHPEPPADGTTMFLTQRNATSSSIMSYTAGSGGADVGIDDGNLGAAAAMSVAIGSGGNNPGNPSLGSMLGTVRNLIGASVTTGAKLNYIDGSSGIFFVFPDLSIRKDGIYRDSSDVLCTTTYIKARTFSEPFQVYSAKQFPGMIESTPLSKHFAKQGVKIPVRKESGKNNDADDDDWIN